MSLIDKTILKEWPSFVRRMNELGIPLPLLRDPKTKMGSVSLTLTFVSFNIVAIGLIGKASGLLGGIDISQALNLFYACAGLYWGRNFKKIEPHKKEDLADLQETKRE